MGTHHVVDSMILVSELGCICRKGKEWHVGNNPEGKSNIAPIRRRLKCRRTMRAAGQVGLVAFFESFSGFEFFPGPEPGPRSAHQRQLLGSSAQVSK